MAVKPNWEKIRKSGTIWNYIYLGFAEAAIIRI